MFTVAWRRLDRVPVGDEALRWLYGVAYRVVSHHWRSVGRRKRLEKRVRSVAAQPSYGPEPQVVRRHEYDLVIEASTNLRPLDQEVLRLAIWEELGHAEIADLLDSTVPAVRQRFHRAKRALAKQYERIGGVLPPPAVAQEGVSDDT